MVRRQLNFLSPPTHFSRIVCLSPFVLGLILIIVSVCVYKKAVPRLVPFKCETGRNICLLSRTGAQLIFSVELRAKRAADFYPNSGWASITR